MTKTKHSVLVGKQRCRFALPAERKLHLLKPGAGLKVQALRKLAGASVLWHGDKFSLYVCVVTVFQFREKAETR